MENETLYLSNLQQWLNAEGYIKRAQDQSDNIVCIIWRCTIGLNKEEWENERPSICCVLQYIVS